MKENYQQPAFPELRSGTESIDLYDKSGMTLLDYFAAKAMQGAACRPEIYSAVKDAETCAAFAYAQAAAMLEERKKYIK